MTSASRTTVLTIVTPEGVSFPLHLASPLVRSVAWMVDVSLIAAVIWALLNLLNPFLVVMPDIAIAFTLLALFAVELGYFILFEWLWKGRTLGKRLLGLRVMDAAGLDLSFHQVVVRNLLRFIDWLPRIYLLGGIVSLLSPRYQRLGDLAAQTIVVRVIPSFEPNLSMIEPGKFNSLRAYPHLIARLRKAVGPDESAVLLNALLRRNALDPDARAVIYAELAQLIRARSTFPAEALDGLSDEHYLGNVADILYRR